MSEERSVVFPLHEFEHFVASALQRNVEVGHEGATTGAIVDEFVGEKIRFDAADAEPLDAFHAVKGFDEVDESFVIIAAKLSDVDACQHNLSPAVGCSLLGLPH